MASATPTQLIIPLLTSYFVNYPIISMLNQRFVPVIFCWLLQNKSNLVKFGAEDKNIKSLWKL